MLPWVEANVIKPIAMERPIWHPAGFSGTFDLLAYTKEHGDEPVLIDYKTSRRSRLANPSLLRDYQDQLAAYSAGIYHTYGVEVNRACLVIGLENKLELKSMGKFVLECHKNSFMERVEEFHKSKCKARVSN